MNPRSIFNPLRLLLTAALLTVTSAQAAIFAKFDGVEGESADRNHDKWIDVLSVDWGASAQAHKGRSSRPTAAVAGDLTLLVAYDKASPEMMQKFLAGETIATLEIDVEPALPAGSTKYKLKDVIVTSFQFMATDGGDAALQLTLSYKKIRSEYTTVVDGTPTTIVFEAQTRVGLLLPAVQQ